MNPLYMTNGSRCKIILCSIAIVTSLCVISMFHSDAYSSFHHFKRFIYKAITINDIDGKPSTTKDDSIPLLGRVKLTLRMSAKPELVHRLLCWMLRSAALFWNPRYGDIVIILDQNDTAKETFFPRNLTTLKLPFTYRLIYEKEPKQAQKFKDSIRYNRGYGFRLQIYSYFMMDQFFKEDDIIALIDTDTSFTMPVVDQSIMVDGKLVVKGFNMFHSGLRPRWDQSTMFLLGYPMVADFMSYFPVYLFPRTIRNCREFIMKRHNVTSFEDIFLKSNEVICSRIVVLSYAYYFEKDSYIWHIDTWPQTRFEYNHGLHPKNNPFPAIRYNKGLPSNHTLTESDIIPEFHQSVHGKYYQCFYDKSKRFSDSLQLGICYLQLRLGMKNLTYCSHDRPGEKLGDKPIRLLYKFECSTRANHFHSWLNSTKTSGYARKIVEERYDVIRELYEKKAMVFKTDLIKVVDDYSKKSYRRSCDHINFQPFT